MIHPTSPPMAPSFALQRWLRQRLRLAQITTVALVAMAATVSTQAAAVQLFSA